MLRSSSKKTNGTGNGVRRVTVLEKLPLEGKEMILVGQNYLFDLEEGGNGFHEGGRGKGGRGTEPLAIG